MIEQGDDSIAQFYVSRTRSLKRATDWTYGFAELARGQREAIAASTRLSNPGCYPTGFLALVRPLVEAPFEAIQDLAVVASPCPRRRRSSA